MEDKKNKNKKNKKNLPVTEVSRNSKKRRKKRRKKKENKKNGLKKEKWAMGGWGLGMGMRVGSKRHTDTGLNAC